MYSKWFDIYRKSHDVRINMPNVATGLRLTPENLEECVEGRVPCEQRRRLPSKSWDRRKKLPPPFLAAEELLGGRNARGENARQCADVVR